MKLHQQDKLEFCGNAVAQMILEADGAKIFDQSKLVTSLKTNGPNGWSTEPQRLATLLTSRNPSKARYYVYLDNDSAVACARLAATTATGAVAAVVYKGQHWVAISSVLTDNAVPPQVTGLIYNDPFPSTASQVTPDVDPPPPPHEPNDSCGSGNAYGYHDSLATILGWKDYWPDPPEPPFNPNATPAKDNAPYVTVARAGLGTISLSAHDGPKTALDDLNANLLPATANLSEALGETELIDKRQAMAYAASSISEYGPEYGPTIESLVGARPHGAQLVQYRRAYYLVTLQRHGRSIGLARVRAYDGAFLGAIASASVHDLPPHDHDLVRRALVANAPCLRTVVARSDIEHGAFTVDPTLVWQPCRESMSPYFPFAKIHIAGTTLYLACDGQIHRRLDDDIHA